MRLWLLRHGNPEPEVALERLAEIGALDDEGFARRFADDKRDLAGWGAGRIREALAARGVPGELIEAALADEDAEQELERAIGLLAGRGADVSSEAARGRALSLLARRGFDAELAYDAVRAYERTSGAA